MMTKKLLPIHIFKIILGGMDYRHYRNSHIGHEDFIAARFRNTDSRDLFDSVCAHSGYMSSWEASSKNTSQSGRTNCSRMVA